MKRLYLDASSIIYRMEGDDEFRRPTTQRVLEHLKDPEAKLLTSRLSRLECRVKPLRDGDTVRLAEYDEFFDAERLDLVELTANVIECATARRSQHGFKTADALHLAAAFSAEAVLTGDPAWQRCSEVAVEVVTPAAKSP